MADLQQLSELLQQEHKDNRQDHQLLFRKLETVSEQVSRLREDLAAMKVRAGFWGSLAGALSGGVAYLALWLKK